VAKKTELLAHFYSHKRKSYSFKRDNLRELEVPYASAFDAFQTHSLKDTFERAL